MKSGALTPYILCPYYYYVIWAVCSRYLQRVTYKDDCWALLPRYQLGKQLAIIIY